MADKKSEHRGPDPVAPERRVVGPGTRTWADVQAAARNCPVLHRMLELERQGLPREAALIDAVLVLSNARELLMAQAVDLLKRLPFSPLVVPANDIFGAAPTPGRTPKDFAEAARNEAADRQFKAITEGPAGTVPVRVFGSKVDHLVHSSAVAVASAGGWTVEQAEFGLKRLLNSRIRLDQAVRLMVAYGLLQVTADAATRQKMLEDLTDPDLQ